jgi:molybdate transport system substrate-binding protein
MRKTLFSLAIFCLLTAFAVLPATAAEITVSGAASLTNAFTEMKDAFGKKHPAIGVVTNFAASNPLLRQIEGGAPVDVFASADQATMDKAAAKGLIDTASRVDFARNGLVLIVPASNDVGLKDVAGLTDKAVKRIAVGNPASVPAGRYGKAALTSAGLWDVLQPKLIMGESVRQTLDYVSRGEVEAGIVYMTDAKQAGAKVRVVSVLSGHDPVLYPLAVVKTGKAPIEAKTFIDFVLSPEGAAIMSKYGFSKP